MLRITSPELANQSADFANLRAYAGRCVSEQEVMNVVEYGKALQTIIAELDRQHSLLQQIFREAKSASDPTPPATFGP